MGGDSTTSGSVAGTGVDPSSNVPFGSFCSFVECLLTDGDAVEISLFLLNNRNSLSQLNS